MAETNGGRRRLVSRLSRRRCLCLWPGCREEVQPRFWGCFRHFMRLPQPLRDRTQAAHREGDADTLAEAGAWAERYEKGLRAEGGA